MSKRILIVESDASASRSMRAALETKGFHVDETTDGKGCVELIRRERPELVVLAVDSAANQNGYLICGKLKKDDELRAVPIIITGNPDGFLQHKKLKTRADDYVAKPVDVDALVNTAGAIIGFPEVEPSAAEVVEDESLSLSDLVDEDGLGGGAADADPDVDDGATGEIAAEEIAVEGEGTLDGDPALDMLDAAFDDISDKPEEAVQAPAEVEEEVVGFETLGEDGSGDASSSDSALDSLGEEEEENTSVTNASPYARAPAPPPPTHRTAPPPRGPAAGPSADVGELRELRTRVRELEAALSDSTQRATDAEARSQELEGELSTKAAEVETARSAGGKSDKDFFALREAGNKKDKEILRLKSELNEKDQEIVELKDREMQLEQQVSESSGEMARRDAQIKTLTTKSDQLAGERRKIDQQLLQAKEEARGASARLATLEGEVEDLQQRIASSDGELSELRGRAEDAESQLSVSREEAEDLRRQLDEQRTSADSARSELDDMRSQLEQAQMDLDSAKNQLTSQATAFAEEAASMRRPISELEETSSKHEDRVTKLYGRIKGEEKVREKTKKALSIAMQLLDEQQHLSVDDDEPAVA